MSLSVVSVAMHLSGLDFTRGDYKVRWLYEDSARKLHAGSPALSTASTTSSSGFNSWGSDPNINKEDVTLTPGQEIEKKKGPVIMHNKRDILNLSENLRDPSWNLRASELPKDARNFFENRSQYSRVKGDRVPLHVDERCDSCDFIVSLYE